MDTQERMWTPEDVSAFLGVPVPTLYRWLYTGTGPTAYRLGKHLRFDPTEGSRAWVKAGGMSIEKHGDCWRARYRGPDGRERNRSFGRTIGAERWLTGQNPE